MSSATARLIIPGTYLNVLVTVEAADDSLTGSYTTEVTIPGQVGSAATEVQILDGVRRLTATRVS